jgi:ABC-2 type transport system ATP-binding protein
MCETLLKAQHLNKTYTDHKAVIDFDLEVRSGEIYTILGQNGAGKSSVLRMLSGIFLPDSGKLELNITKKIGYLPEERGLYQNMKVFDHLNYLLKLKGMEEKKLRSIIQSSLAKVGLEDWQNKQLKQLSKGMQQKVQFLAAILHEPELVILDEPFSGLDPVSLKSICEIILDLKTKGVGIIISAHQMGILEEICDHYIFLKKGQTVWKGNRNELKDHFGQNCYRFQIGENSTGEIVWPDNLKASILLSKVLSQKNENVQDYEINLADSKHVTEIFEFLFGKYKVKRFEHYSPSLNEAFKEFTI